MLFLLQRICGTELHQAWNHDRDVIWIDFEKELKKKKDK